MRSLKLVNAIAFWLRSETLFCIQHGVLLMLRTIAVLTLVGVPDTATRSRVAGSATYRRARKSAASDLQIRTKDVGPISKVNLK